MHWLWTLLGALAALTAVAALYTWFHVRRAQRRHPPVGEHLQVEDVDVHLVRAGQGPPVLLLHGLNGFMQDWTGTDIMEELARDHDVVAIDRPGYGHSSRPRQELSDPRVQADWLVALMDALDWDRPPIVVGHSWGGGLAMTLAVRHPERVAGLVLVGPYVNPRTEPGDWIHRLPRVPLLRSWVARCYLVPVVRSLGPRYVSASFGPEDIPDGYHRMWVEVSAQPAHFDTTLDEVRTVDPALATVAPRYREVAVPVTVITGDSDQSVDPERNARWLVERLPDAELVWLEGVGHMVPWLHAQHVLAAVRDVKERAAKGR